MSQVTRAIDYTATTNANGVVVVNGDFPGNWTDVTGVVASAVQNAFAVKAEVTGSNQVTYTLYRKKPDGTVGPVANTQVEWMALLCGVA